MDQILHEVTIESIRISLLISLPLLGASLIVGLIISIFQATTSIQEQTLTFVPKIIAIVLALVIFGPWIVETLKVFTIQIFDIIPDLALPTP
jgi:flagellar biosynthetic protein FliQ